MLCANQKYYDYDDVLILPRHTNISSRNDVNLENTFTGKHSNKSITTVPIIAANMDTTGTLAMASALSKHGMVTALHKHYKYYEISQAVFDEELDLTKTFISIGLGENERTRLRNISHSIGHVPNICIDVANGYTQDFIDYIETIRKEFPKSLIMAGNVATPEMIKVYDNVGVDIVKIGIGPGNFCRTRTTAGVGVPQLSAVLMAVEAADKVGIGICADGGINEFCDFSKAFVAGADFVMAGSMFAGHTESGGEVIVNENGSKSIITYGMSSEEAMKKYSGGIKEYRASEGRTVAVPYKGDVDNTVRNILGSLRSTMTYTDVREISNLHQAKMIPVNRTINTAQIKDTIGL